MPALRPATLTDAADLAAVHVQCWRQTYRDLPEEWWQIFTTDAKTADWQQILGAGGTDRVIVVAEQAGQIIGFAGAGDTRRRPDVINGAPRELYVLYVLAEHHGTGVGQALLDAIGAGHLQLWVAEDNPRAHAFYARNGFHPDGAVDQLEEICGGMPHVRLVRRP